MTTPTTDAEAIRDALGVLRIKWRGHDDASIDDASIDEAVTAILSYLASRREAQEPVAKDGLLPCPFCGGTAETDSQQAYLNISTGRPETAVAVYCTSCSAQHTICRGDVPDAELSDVTELWNRRTTSPSPAPAGEVERLRGEIAYALTKRLVIDMPTARAAIDEAFAALNGGRSE